MSCSSQQMEDRWKVHRRSSSSRPQSLEQALETSETIFHSQLQKTGSGAGPCRCGGPQGSDTKLHPDCGRARETSADEESFRGRRSSGRKRSASSVPSVTARLDGFPADVSSCSTVDSAPHSLPPAD